MAQEKRICGLMGTHLLKCSNEEFQAWLKKQEKQKEAELKNNK